MIRFYRIVDAGSSLKWTLGQFPDEKSALSEYNAEIRHARSEGIEESRPELTFADRAVEVEYFLTEEELSHTEVNRDESIETGRWGLVEKSA